MSDVFGSVLLFAFWSLFPCTAVTYYLIHTVSVYSFEFCDAIFSLLLSFHLVLQTNRQVLELKPEPKHQKAKRKQRQMLSDSGEPNEQIIIQGLDAQVDELIVAQTHIQTKKRAHDLIVAQVHCPEGR